MMVGLLLLALLCGGVSAGSHSLRHFYTAVTPGSGVPEFMEVGYVDEEQIIYYDSVLGRTVPRQQWMAESQGPDYWERETQISRSHEQWAQAKIQTLMMRTNQTGGIHFLQRMYGCELRDDGTTTGFNQYGWDGSDFITFDKDRMVWVTPVPWGVITKAKWDRNTAMNQGLKGYLEQECIERVKRYVKAGESHLQPNPPEVSFTASKDGRHLSCVATGFFPQSIDVTILRDGRTLEETHSHGILPNHDNTYQLTTMVMVEPTDTAMFSCRVEHRGLPEPLVLFFAGNKGYNPTKSSHSLRHFYTAVTPGSGVPEFMAVGYVDEEQIIYYDSVLGRTVPRQQWMAESQGPDYWERETQISRSHEQWAQVKIQTFMMRTNQTGGIHFLQRMYGCELRDDGTTTGFDQYGWDGSDFISFDKDRMVWVTPVPWGVITKDKWDQNTAVNLERKRYLEQECIEWLKRYVRAGESHLQPNPPEVWFTTSKDGSLLSCVATGFYPQSIDMTILRNGRTLEETHSHGILPNHDNTYQLTRTVQVEPTDTAMFSCWVEHRGLPEPLVLFLGNKGYNPTKSSHSLRHFYTAVTPGSGVPEFMAVGYVDEEQIIYYDSVLGRTVPRQQWMAESQGPDYWERETQISRSHEQWAQVKIQTLMMRTNQTGGIHFLQRMYGCELRDDGTTTGFDQYGWDGSDFISFDKDRMVWVTPVPWGVITKDKWDQNTAVNLERKRYLEQECIEWLKRYVRAGESHLQPNPPEVWFTTSKDGSLLSCVATGFYPQSIDMTILRNGRTLEETHSHGILPNHDNTYQLTRTVQVEPTDTAMFSCWVEHRGLPEPLVLFLAGNKGYNPTKSSHSLRHFYTAVTPGSGVPEFMAVGYVDEEQIIYYDSVLGRTVPRQQWMAESQGPDYWERETQISRSHEQWAQVKIQTLMMRTNQTGGIHFLQRMYGCELRDDGTTTGFDQYGWDGSDFISFDKDRMVWVTPVPWGVITKDKWDQNTAGNLERKRYLEQECIEWLKRYVRAGESHLKPNPPEVWFTTSKDGSLLSCVATGFYPQSIDMTILRNGRTLEETHSHGILPNHDNTYQLTRTVQVEPTDTAMFSCWVEHRGLPEPLVLFLAGNKGYNPTKSSHSLRHFYTAVTPGSGVPEFMEVGYVDEEQIIYYDSVLGRTVPRQQWMAESQGSDYWERATQISRSHEQWAQVKIQTLMMRTNQTGGIHFLQRMYGCELRDDGTTTGFNQYGWDGSDFISFDKDWMVWVTPVPWGVITKAKWDRNTAMNQGLKGYLEQECIERVKRYVRAGESHLKPNPPEVWFTASKDGSLLSCVATGFYPQSIDMTILRNGRTLEETHSHGILPNHDNTYQLTRMVMVEPMDTAIFSCWVEHRGLYEPLVLFLAGNKG
ncbi:uncharacterized protein [Hemitrygon akajei]|uniref:uncharacterized protein isoform X3 n=1 Tax=Hemitrygon akajei TaxID=2704970 RepID=UPI003BF9BA31